MRILSLILLTFALPLAAEVQIESLQTEHGNGTYRFPKLLGTGDAVKRINTYLHAIELKLLPDSFESSPFENIWPKEGEIWGVTRLDYHVDRYGPGFLAVTIESDTGGAFTSRQSINYLFDLASGQPIILEQLLSESGLRNLHAQLRQQRSQRITDFLSGEIITNGRDGRAVSLDSSNPERAALQRITYEQCRQTRLGRSIDEEHVHLGSQHLTMSITGCMLPTYETWTRLATSRISSATGRWKMISLRMDTAYLSKTVPTVSVHPTFGQAVSIKVASMALFR